VLDQRWSGAFAGGARVYSVDAFHTAFALIVGWAVLSCILIAFTKDTVCRQTA
jgi:hypothetical protein